MYIVLQESRMEKGRTYHGIKLLLFPPSVEVINELLLLLQQLVSFLWGIEFNVSYQFTKARTDKACYKSPQNLLEEPWFRHYREELMIENDRPVIVVLESINQLPGHGD